MHGPIKSQLTAQNSDGMDSVPWHVPCSINNPFPFLEISQLCALPRRVRKTSALPSVIQGSRHRQKRDEEVLLCSSGADSRRRASGSLIKDGILPNGAAVQLKSHAYSTNDWLPPQMCTELQLNCTGEFKLYS